MSGRSPKATGSDRSTALSACVAILALAPASACAAATAVNPRDAARQELGLSYFRSEIVDGKCSVAKARAGEALASYVLRVGSHGDADLDCVERASADPTPAAGRSSAYYVYQAFLTLRDDDAFVQSQGIEPLLERTGIGDAPISPQMLYAASTLFGVKGLVACDRELAEEATRLGGLRYAPEVNEAARAARTPADGSACRDVQALRILARARLVEAPRRHSSMTRPARIRASISDDWYGEGSHA